MPTLTGAQADMLALSSMHRSLHEYSSPACPSPTTLLQIPVPVDVPVRVPVERKVPVDVPVPVSERGDFRIDLISDACLCKLPRYREGLCPLPGRD